MGGGISKIAKQELLATIRDRYRASSRKEKSRILDEFIAATGHHRKHGIRLLGQSGNDWEQCHCRRCGVDRSAATVAVCQGRCSFLPVGGRDAAGVVCTDPSTRPPDPMQSAPLAGCSKPRLSSVLLASMSHSPCGEYDISAGQLVRTFSLYVDNPGGTVLLRPSGMFSLRP